MALCPTRSWPNKKNVTIRYDWQTLASSGFLDVEKDPSGYLYPLEKVRSLHVEYSISVYCESDAVTIKLVSKSL